MRRAEHSNGIVFGTEFNLIYLLDRVHEQISFPKVFKLIAVNVAFDLFL